MPAKKSNPTTASKPVLLSKTLQPDGATPVANVKRTPIPDVAPVKNGFHVIINIPQQRLFLYQDGVLEKVYPVAVGKAMTQTNLGEHTIGGKAFDPTWHIPKSIQAELKNGKTTVPPGPENPLGPVFVRLGNPKLGLGIHGTNAPSSVPGVRSHGCVRMKSEQALDFAHTITTGSPATVSYEMAALNVDEDNQLWLAVFGDPYNKKNLNTAALKKTVQAWAKANGATISAASIEQIIKGKAGKPICLSCKGKGKFAVKGQLQSLAWNKVTAPKSGSSRAPSDDIKPESNEIEIDAGDDAPSKPVASKAKAASKPNSAAAKKASAVQPNAASEVERPLKPINDTSAFEEKPLTPINKGK
ncbi:L,D-transpeptidase [Alysiella filiformis]|nr:L,D-transpeptidase [Alysiella filiformis]